MKISKHNQKLNKYISPQVEISSQEGSGVAKNIMHEENKPLDYSIAQRLLPLINVQGTNSSRN